MFCCWGSSAVVPLDFVNHANRSSETVIIEKPPVKRAWFVPKFIADRMQVRKGEAVEKTQRTVKKSRLEQLTTPVFALMCRYLSYQDLSQCISVSRDFQGMIQSSLHQDPIPFVNPESIAKANEDTENLLSEMKENFHTTADPLKAELDVINCLQQPLKLFRLQILAAQCCIKWVDPIAFKEMDLKIKAGVKIPYQQAILYRTLNALTYKISTGSHILTRTVLGYRDSRLERNHRKTIVLTKMLLDMEVNLNFHTRDKDPYTYLNVCLQSNAVGHLHVFMERGANLHVPGSGPLPDSISPLMQMCYLSMDKQPAAEQQTIKETLQSLFEYLPDPFRRVNIWRNGVKEVRSADDYISTYVKTGSLGRSSEVNLFEAYKKSYIEIKNEMNRLLPEIDVELILSYIRS